MDQNKLSQDTSKITPKVTACRRILSQVTATSVVILLYLSLGMVIGFPAILIPAVTNDDNADNLHLTMAQASWCASLSFIFQPVGGIMTGLCLQSLGCKTVMILLNIPHIICWLMTYYASSIYTLCFAQAFFGCVLGLIEVPGLRYVSEISEPSVRGIIISSTSFFVSVGYLIMIFIGSLTDWRNAAAISASLPLLCIILLILIPESPMWLMSKGRSEDALRSLQWLRGWTSAQMVHEEFQRIQFYSKNKTQKFLKTDHSGDSRSGSGGLSYFTTSTFLKPLIKCCIIFAIFDFGGMISFRSYLVKILQDLHSPVSSKWSSLWVALFGILGNVGCMLFIKKVKKKPMLRISLLCCILCLIFLTMFLFGYMQVIADSAFHHWCPLIMIVALFFFYNLGIHPIAWAFLGEILPYRGRGPATSFVVCSHNLFTFVSVKTFPNLTQWLGLEGALLVYAGVCLCGILFTYFLPETEGKHLSDIEIEVACGGKTNEDGLKATPCGS
nr:PREDICTED: facilitated trehalose transporter Tret1-like isoform X1 [Bemisia tabaci]